MSPGKLTSNATQHPDLPPAFLQRARWNLAVHEAGHTLAGLALGFELEEVWIAVEGTEASGLTAWKGWRPPQDPGVYVDLHANRLLSARPIPPDYQAILQQNCARRKCLLYLAGSAAVRLLGDELPGCRSTSEVDEREAEGCAAELGLSGEARHGYLRGVYADAQALVGERQRELRTLAEALAASGRLTSAECRALLADPGDGASRHGLSWAQGE